MSTTSNILFLGNGINRCFQENVSWNDVLSKLSDGKYTSWELSRMACPAPLKAIIATSDNVNKKLAQNKQYFFGTASEEQNVYLRKLFDMGFEDIITTNYSYELEMAALGVHSISENKLRKMSAHTTAIDRAEGKYMLHTYNSVLYGGKERRIWHIHGEARKPDSMILGHYYYGNLTAKVKNESDRLGDAYRREGYKCKSWMDLFILGDVYIIGTALDVSEIDLWWLINRKARENGRHGKTVFYDIYSDATGERDVQNKLLDLLKADVRSYKVKGSDFLAQYDKAISDMKKRMK